MLTEEEMYVLGQEVEGKSLHFPLNFAVNLKLIQKMSLKHPRSWLRSPPDALGWSSERRSQQPAAATLPAKPEKRCSCCLSHTKPNKQRQGLNHYGRFIQMASDLRRLVGRTLMDRPTFPLKPAFL